MCSSNAFTSKYDRMIILHIIEVKEKEEWVEWLKSKYNKKILLIILLLFQERINNYSVSIVEFRFHAISLYH